MESAFLRNLPLKRRKQRNQLNVNECYAIEYLAIYKDKRALNFRFRCICLEKRFHSKAENKPSLSSPWNVFVRFGILFASLSIYKSTSFLPLHHHRSIIKVCVCVAVCFEIAAHWNVLGFPPIESALSDFFLSRWLLCLAKKHGQKNSMRKLWEKP